MTRKARRLRLQARLAELLLLLERILLWKARLLRVLVPSWALSPVCHYRETITGRDEEVESERASRRPR